MNDTYTDGIKIKSLTVNDLIKLHESLPKINPNERIEYCYCSVDTYKVIKNDPKLLSFLRKNYSIMTGGIELLIREHIPFRQVIAEMQDKSFRIFKV